MSTEASAQKTATSPKETTLLVRPTLFIAIGGTGMEICMRLRRRLLNHAWGIADARYRMQSLAEFRAAAFIQFDLDSGANIDSGRAQTEDLQYDLVKFPDSDKIVESLPLDKYIGSEDALGRYPLIEEWMPLTPPKIRELNIDPGKGAGQIRAISRLYFFEKYPKIRQMIRSKLNHLKAGLSNSHDLEKLGLKTEAHRARIVMVGSMAGGTGSGSFLDMGYLAKHVGDQVFSRCDVDLFFLSPAGFKQANQERTEANGYAAMMELETLLSEGSAGYLKQWAMGESYEIPRLPYDDVFIVEMGNVAGQVTSDIKDIYQMVADCFFYDFMSGPFADRKRSVAVNQNQHKIKSYNPPINVRKYGETKFSFRRSYSAFGLTVLSTGADIQEDIFQHQLAAELLRSYFGVGPEYQKVNAVDDRTLEDFLKAKLDLGGVSIDPPAQLEKAKLASIASYSLVRQLMVIGGRNVLDAIDQQTTGRLQEIRNQFDRKDWREQLRLVQRSLEQATITDIDSRSDTNEAKLTYRATEILGGLRKDVEDQLYAYLDNPDLGGLEYVLSFIEALKQRIDDSSTGFRKRLLTNESTLREWKSLLQTEIEETYTYLDQVSGKALLGDNQKKAEAKLEHLKSDVSEHLKCHVQMVASTSTAGLLEALSAWLGTRTVDPNTLEPHWSGLAGQFQQGKAAVAGMVERLGIQATIFAKELQTEHAMRVSLPLEVIHFSRPDKKQLREWADEAFTELGQTRTVFQILNGSEGNPTLLVNSVLAKAKAKLSGLYQKRSLIDVLRETDPGERQAKFLRLFQCVFPWISARELDDVKNYKLFLGVKDAGAFKRAFENEIKTSATASGLTLDCEIVETGEEGLAICYCELSGYPLTMLSDLENWRVSYNKEQQASTPIPLHTHRNSVQFRHPMAPSERELEERKKDFQIFLKGVMTGVLTPKKGVYGFYLRRDRFDIGQEALISKDGVEDKYEKRIIEQTQDVLDTDGEEASAAMYALCDFYARYVYPEARYKDENEVDQTVKGMSTFIVEAMRDGSAGAQIEGFQNRLRQHAPERVQDILLRKENIDRWSQEIPGSENDSSKSEIRQFSTEEIMDAQFPYYVKRSLREGWHAQVRQLLNPVAATAASGVITGAAAQMPPPLPSERLVNVSVAGQQSGPFPESVVRTMIQSRQLNPNSTHVWWPGLQNWVLLKDCPDLMAMVPPPPPG